MVIALAPEKWTPEMEEALDLLIAGGMTSVTRLMEVFLLTSEEIAVKLEERYPEAMRQRRRNQSLGRIRRELKAC